MPMAMRIWPTTSSVSGSGFVRNVPSAFRNARTSAPVRVADLGSAEALPDERGAGRHRDLLQAQLDAAVAHHDVEELGDVGCSRNAAIRAPPISCGLTTRSAPARVSFSMLDSSRARATMNRSGRSARPERVMKRFVGVCRQRGDERRQRARCRRVAARRRSSRRPARRDGGRWWRRARIVVHDHEGSRRASSSSLAMARPTRPQPTDDHVVTQRLDAACPSVASPWPLRGGPRR